MELELFCSGIPKIELHAHLNGSLSQSTMLKLKRYHADSGILDPTNAFFAEFQIGSGDTRSLTDCFQVFAIAHALTSTPEALSLATSLTLKEFEEDGCCYIELRSTPRNTEHMHKREYLETIIKSMKKSSKELAMISRLIVSINRANPVSESEEITDLAIEYYKKYSDVVVGIELSGNPAIGNFIDFVPALERARKAGLKVTLHCAEIENPKEVIEMLQFKPERIGHGTCIHPKFGGTDETWSALCNSKIPVEVCLTSNVNTKSTPDYESHHFKELNNAKIPMIICTDDKGVFSTSLSQEYNLCAVSYNLSRPQIAELAFNAYQYIFDKGVRDILKKRFQEFIAKYPV